MPDCDCFPLCRTSVVFLALAAALFAALAVPTASQGGMTLTIPGIVQPDIQAVRWLNLVQ